MVLSLWAMTMLSLYIRVQVNILGRYLYIDTARILGSSYALVRACCLFSFYVKILSKLIFCSSELLGLIILCTMIPAIHILQMLTALFSS